MITNVGAGSRIGLVCCICLVILSVCIVEKVFASEAGEIFIKNFQDLQLNGEGPEKGYWPVVEKLPEYMRDFDKPYAPPEGSYQERVSAQDSEDGTVQTWVDSSRNLQVTVHYNRYSTAELAKNGITSLVWDASHARPIAYSDTGVVQAVEVKNCKPAKFGDLSYLLASSSGTGYALYCQSGKYVFCIEAGEQKYINGMSPKIIENIEKYK